MYTPFYVHNNTFCYAMYCVCFGVRGLECVSGRSPSARHKFALLAASFVCRKILQQL